MRIIIIMFDRFGKRPSQIFVTKPALPKGFVPTAFTWRGCCRGAASGMPCSFMPQSTGVGRVCFL
ncbi:hypothetical protein BN2476_370033 [Paraburkholderia piptadeniae]|uniref:Uncharacterized protein n=1 Tax=Paraburkholderia piptadeniae TaxID=1701573 RepID=A0A1N7S9E0_9BURK|nr:hypothetical protein BN2476_370033 [Paraburkholderia piptadeniae]